MDNGSAEDNTSDILKQQVPHNDPSAPLQATLYWRSYEDAAEVRLSGRTPEPRPRPTESYQWGGTVCI